MTLVKYGAILLITFVIVAGIAVPLADSPSSLLEFPRIPMLEEKARNIFFHVPVAWVTVVAFFVSMVSGIFYLRKSEARFDIVSVVSSKLGFMFCFLATITGSLWAKFNWGSFWNWDPRETSIFVLLLIYGAYFALRSAVDDEEKRGRLSAVYSIIAGLVTPFFIFVLPRMMTGLHPGSKGDEAGAGPVVNFSMSGNMLFVFFCGLIGFSLLYVWMMNLFVRAELIDQSLREKGETTA